MSRSGHIQDLCEFDIDVLTFGQRVWIETRRRSATPPLASVDLVQISDDGAVLTLTYTDGGIGLSWLVSRGGTAELLGPTP